VPWLHQNYQRFCPSLTWQVAPRIRGVLARLAPGARVVDLGAGGRRLTPRTICVDVVPHANTVVCGDALRLPFQDRSLDTVIGTGLLEHVEGERAVLYEVARVLEPGELAHMELPFLQRYRDDPFDGRRFTVDVLARTMRRAGPEPLDSGFHIGPTLALVTLASYDAALWFQGRTKVMKAVSTTVCCACCVCLWPLKFLHRLLLHTRSARRLAFGVYCTARNP
jgi:SAM-dependent methyltransferase